MILILTAEVTLDHAEREYTLYNVTSRKAFINRHLLISTESLSGTIREAAIK